MLESGWIVSTPMNLTVPGNNEEEAFEPAPIRRKSDVLPLPAASFNIRKNSVGKPYVLSLYQPPSPGLGGPVSLLTAQTGLGPVTPTTTVHFTTPDYSARLKLPTVQQQTSPQLRLSRSVTNLQQKGTVRVMAITNEINTPLPGHSALRNNNNSEEQPKKGFSKRIFSSIKEAMGSKETRRASEPETAAASVGLSGLNFYSEPSANVRPLLQKPIPRTEKFCLTRTLPASPPPTRHSEAPRRPESHQSHKSHFSIASSQNSMQNSASIMEPLMDFDAVYEVKETVDKKWLDFVDHYANGYFNLSIPPLLPDGIIAPRYLAAPNPPDNDARLEALKAYQISLVSVEEVERECGLLISRAKHEFGVRWATISYIGDDNEEFQLNCMEDVPAIPLQVSIGAHAILSTQGCMVIGDTSKDWRFKQNPLVNCSPGVGFYAGAPIVNDKGYVIGVFGLSDPRPKTKLTFQERRSLCAYADLVMKQLQSLVEVMSVRKELSDTRFGLKRGPYRPPTSDSVTDKSAFDRYMVNGPPTTTGSVSSIKESETTSLIKNPVRSAIPVRTKQRPFSIIEPADDSDSFVSNSTPARGVSTIAREVAENAVKANRVSEALSETQYGLSIVSKTLDIPYLYLVRIRPISAIVKDEDLVGAAIYMKILTEFGSLNHRLPLDPNTHLEALRSKSGLHYSCEEEVGSPDRMAGVLIPIQRDPRNDLDSNLHPMQKIEYTRGGVIFGAHCTRRAEFTVDEMVRLEIWAREISRCLLKVDKYYDSSAMNTI